MEGQRGRGGATSNFRLWLFPHSPQPQDCVLLLSHPSVRLQHSDPTPASLPQLFTALPRLPSPRPTRTDPAPPRLHLQGSASSQHFSNCPLLTLGRSPAFSPQVVLFSFDHSLLPRPRIAASPRAAQRWSWAESTSSFVCVCSCPRRRCRMVAVAVFAFTRESEKCVFCTRQQLVGRFDRVQRRRERRGSTLRSSIGCIESRRTCPSPSSLRLLSLLPFSCSCSSRSTSHRTLPPSQSLLPTSLQRNRPSSTSPSGRRLRRTLISRRKLVNW